MENLFAFLAPDRPSLKICGITSAEEAQHLASLGVPALGINFWPQSRRHCPPATGLTFLPELSGKIVRVGVFVNNARDLAFDLFAQGALDLVQLHGDEDDKELTAFLAAGLPVIRSLSLPAPEEIPSRLAHFRALALGQPAPLALLLDAHAPHVYGGTGETIDWERAGEFIRLAAPLPVLLAGGIGPANAAQALAATHPAGLDVASGAEHSPGKKDFQKVAALLHLTQSHPPRP